MLLKFVVTQRSCGDRINVRPFTLMMDSDATCDQLIAKVKSTLSNKYNGHVSHLLYNSHAILTIGNTYHSPNLNLFCPLIFAQTCAGVCDVDNADVAEGEYQIGDVYQGEPSTKHPLYLRAGSMHICCTQQGWW